MGIIYILENKINGKYYVGQTTNLFKYRFKQHQKSNSVIGKALRKYGSENFNKILIENIPEEKLDEAEVEYIQKYSSMYPNGYNLTFGGDGGKKSEEARKNMSEAHKNYVFTEEHKRKLKEARKGKKPTLGKHLSDETKRKMSEAKRNMSDETKRKMSEAKRNMSDETKRKMSESRKEHSTSEETRKKISDSIKLNWLGRSLTKSEKKSILKKQDRKDKKNLKRFGVVA